VVLIDRVSPEDQETARRSESPEKLRTPSRRMSIASHSCAGAADINWSSTRRQVPEHMAGNDGSGAGGRCGNEAHVLALITAPGIRRGGSGCGVKARRLMMTHQTMCDGRPPG